MKPLTLPPQRLPLIRGGSMKPQVWLHYPGRGTNGGVTGPSRSPLRVKLTPLLLSTYYSSAANPTTRLSHNRSSSPPPSSSNSQPHLKVLQQKPLQQRTPLQTLAAQITFHADALAAYSSPSLSTSHSSSFSNHQNPFLLPRSSTTPSLRVESEHHLTALRDALSKLSILTTSPADFVPQLAASNNTFWCLAWLVHFGIPELLPLDIDDDHLTSHKNERSHDTTQHDGTLPGLEYTTVAAKARVPLDQLKSIARMAMLSGFLSEKKRKPGEEEKLCHSPLSASMTRRPELLEWMRFVTRTSAPMVAAMVEATERWGRDTTNSTAAAAADKGEKNITQTAYAAAWKTNLPLFAHVASDPDLQGRYARYMRVMTQHNEGLAVRHLLEGWRGGWEELASSGRNGVLVDVGGGLGHVSRAIIKEFPGIGRVVVQDRGEVVERARRETQEVKGLEGVHISFQAHDFFTPQPAVMFENDDMGKGQGQVAVYLLRQILHDWDDDRAITILGHLADAMEKAGPSTRLIVMDTILPLPGDDSTGEGEDGRYSSSRTEEALLRVRDLTMMQAHNAHERTMSEWEDLLARAHPELRIRRVVKPFKSLMAVMEISFGSYET